MGNFCILRMKKLKSASNVNGALCHHLRTKETPNAELDDIYKNWIYPKNVSDENLPGKMCDVNFRKEQKKIAMALFRKNLPQKFRKDCVQAVELMMTISPEVLQNKAFNPQNYLQDCLSWTQKRYGKQNVFFATIHNDETTPHISILFTPIDERGHLNCKKFFGGREKMQQFQTDFYEEVGRKYGLDRGIKGSKAKHKTIKEYYGQLNDFDNDVKSVADKIYLNMPKKKPLFQSENDWKKDIYKSIFHFVKPIAQNSFLYQETKDKMENLNQKVAEITTNFNQIVTKKTVEIRSETWEQIKQLEKENQELKKQVSQETEKKQEIQKEFTSFKNNPKALKKRISDIDYSREM